MRAVSLRSTILRGGAYLAVRQAVGTAIAIGGVVVLTRLIGPAQYGVYAGAMGVFLVAQIVAQLGINIFIIRSERDIDATTRDTATTLLVVLGVAISAVLLASIPFIESATRLAGIGPIAIAVFLTLPITQLSQIPQSMLERALDYRRVATAELVSQITFMAVSIPIAIREPAAIALAIGWAAQQSMLCVMLHAAARHVPRLGWDAAVAREAVTYGLAYTASTWLFQLRRLVNPVVVGRYLGAEAVGIVSVTTQIVTHLSFIAVATWRLSTAALARLQSDRARMARAIEEGMLLQMIAVAPFLLLFAILGHYFVSALMGERWDGVATLFPYLALVSLTTGVFNLHASALYVLKQNSAMALYHVAHTTVLALSALLLVPRWGLTGYGVAEAATILTFWVLHERALHHVPRISYGLVGGLLVGIAPALFFQVTGWWTALPLIVTIAVFKPWQRYRTAFAQMRAVGYES